MLSKWFGLGENECFVVGLGLSLLVVRARVEIGADLGSFLISFVLVHRKCGYRDFVLSKDLVSLKSVSLLSEGLQFYQGAT